MELNWERGRGAVHLSLDEINALLAPADYRAVLAELIFEGLANTNYRVETDDALTLVLRIGQRDPSTQGKEVALSRLLGSAIPIPEVHFHDEARGVLVMSWLPGITLQRLMAGGDNAQVLAAGRSLGATLGMIASHQFPAAGLLTEELSVNESWPSVYDGLRGFLEHGLAKADLDPTLSDAIRARWDRDRNAIEVASQAACLSHGDYKPANLLIDGGKVSGVLDWEFAHAGTWLLDAGQLLRYTGDLRDDLAKEVDTGLTEVGLVSIPEDWPELARTIDLASLVDFLARPGTKNRQKSDVLDLIGNTLTS